MALIIGSRHETLPLRELVTPEFRDLVGLGNMTEVLVVKDWMLKQPHLPQITDEQIILFLHSCYNSIERTKEKIENYYTFRAQAQEVFGRGGDLETDLREVLKVVRLAPLPHHCKSHQGHILAIMGLIDPNPNKFDFEKSVRANFAMVDLIVARHPLSEGYQVIYDMRGLQLAHIGRINFSILKKALVYVQQASPVRLKAVHIINAGSLAFQLLEMFKPFMKKELADLIHIHPAGDFHKFTDKFVPLKFLPFEYGGSLCSADKLNDEFFKDAILAKDWLVDVGRSKVDETKRSKNVSRDTASMTGSFKKLEID